MKYYINIYIFGKHNIYSGISDQLLVLAQFDIKTHDSESRGQEEAAVRDE